MVTGSFAGSAVTFFVNHLLDKTVIARMIELLPALAQDMLGSTGGALNGRMNAMGRESALSFPHKLLSTIGAGILGGLIIHYAKPQHPDPAAEAALQTIPSYLLMLLYEELIYPYMFKPALNAGSQKIGEAYLWVQQKTTAEPMEEAERLTVTR